MLTSPACWRRFETSMRRIFGDEPLCIQSLYMPDVSPSSRPDELYYPAKTLNPSKVVLSKFAANTNETVAL